MMYRRREERDLNMTLVKQLRCSVCRRTCLPPIVMCNSQHIICHVCQEHFTDCVICRQPITTKRNHLAETLCTKVKLPCRNAVRGCADKVYLHELSDHLSVCPFRIYECKFICTHTMVYHKCEWKGSLSQLHYHVSKHHPSHLELLSFPLVFEGECVLQMGAVPLKHCRLFCAGGQYFWFKETYYPVIGELWLLVMYVGPDDSASSFQYTLVMNNTSDLRNSYKQETRSLTFTSDTLPLSVGDTHGNVCKLSYSCMKGLSRDGALQYTLYVDAKHT